MKHLWYCDRCNAVFYMPFLAGSILQTGELTITEVERPCIVCKDKARVKRCDMM